MEKRGVATVVEAILGILLIVVVLFAMGAPAIEYAKDKFFKEGKFQPPWRKGEFTPYVTVLSPEEKAVDSSMNALIFAIESTAEEKPTETITVFGSSLDLTKEKEKKAEEAAKKEENTETKENKEEKETEKEEELTKKEIEKSITVSCGGSLKLILGKKEEAVKEFGQAILDCFKAYKKTNKDIRCNDIIADGLEGSVTKNDVFNWLNEQSGMDISDLTRGLWISAGLTWDIKEPITKESDKYCINFDGKRWDNVYVGQCYGKYEPKFHCDLKNFELPQEINEEGLAKWIDYIKYLGDPKYIVYYEQFPNEEGAAWQVDAYKLAYGWMIFSGVMNAGPFKLAKSIKGLPRASLRVGKEAVGAVFEGIQKLGRKITKEEIEETEKQFSKEIVKNEFTWKRFLRFAGSKWWLETSLPAEDIIRKSLLQEILDEETAVKLFKNIEIDDILTKYGKTATKEELGEKILQKLVKGSNAYNELAEDLARQPLIEKRISKEGEELWKLYKETPRGEFNWMLGERKILRSEFPIEFEAGAIKTYKDIPDEKIQKEIFEKIQKEAYDISEGLPQDAIGKIAREGVLDTEIKALTNELGDDIYKLGKLTKEQLENLQNFRSLLKNTIDANGNLDTKAVVNMIKDSADRFPSSESLRRKAIKFLADDTSPYLNMIDENGYIKFGYLVGNRLDAATRKNMEDAFFEATKKNVWGPLKSNDVGRGIWINLFGDAQGWPEFVANQIPVTYKGGIIGGTVAKMTMWPFRHRYFTLAMLYFYSSYLDSMDEKNYPHGINTIQLTHPSKIGVGRAYSLKEELTDYYINMKKDSGGFNRFFLASPCKTDLRLTKEKCLCEAEAGSDILLLSGGSQKVVKGTVSSDSPEYWYAFDQENGQKKMFLMIDCSENKNFCITDIKSNPKWLESYVKYLYDNLLPKARKGIKEYMNKKGINKDTEISPVNILVKEQKTRANHQNGYLGDEDYEALKIFFFNSNGLLISAGILENPKSSSPRPQKMLENMPSFEEYLKLFQDYGIEYVMVPIQEMFKSYMADMNKKFSDKNYDYDFSLIDGVMYGDFFGENKLFWEITKKHYPYYFRHKKDQSNYENTVKECNNLEFTSSATDTFALLKKGFNYESVQLLTSCINIDTSMIKYANYNGGYNYCYTGKHPVIGAIRAVNVVLFMVADAYMTAQTGGLWIFAMAGTGVAQEWIDQQLVIKGARWPSHGTIYD